MNFAKKSTIPCDSDPLKLPDLVFSYSGQFVRTVLDLVLPPRCVVTGEILAEKSGLSPAAWGQLTFIAQPFCATCADPFDFDENDADDAARICASCLDHPPTYQKARAALVYDDASRPILLGFKHGDKIYMAPFLARLMVAAGEDVLKDADLIVPVPLHWTRLVRRRYNQAALLVQQIGRLSGKETSLNALMRTQATPPQGHLSAKDRAKNVARVFTVSPRVKARIEGKNILLVDDVLTSGATVEACTKALLKAGANSVNVLCLVRAKSR
ncbi:MAG: ComF family protein [Pseudobdellovibrionaceae bacterium]